MQSDVPPADAPVNESARTVFEALLLAGPLSRAELARRLSLSAGSLTKITRPLLDAGCLREATQAGPQTGGRPSQPLDVDEGFAHFIGIKLTGEGLFGVVTDARARVLRSMDAYLFDQSVDAVVGQIVNAVNALRAGDERIAGIGISLSGNATRDEPTVRTSPFLHWHGVPLATKVTDLTGLPAVLDNDVRALTAAEHWFGAGVGLESFALMTFGAGIGCGMVVNGAQIEGRQGASGLIGHLPIDDRGQLCYAGHRGCAHAFATSTGLVRTVSSGLGLPMLGFEECVELARKGDPVAATAFDEAGRAIGQLIATVVNLIGPERVLISGEGAAMYQLGEMAARKRLSELLHWTATAPDVVVRPLDFTDWARGAAVIAIQQHIRQLTSVRPIDRSAQS